MGKGPGIYHVRLQSRAWEGEAGVNFTVKEVLSSEEARRGALLFLQKGEKCYGHEDVMDTARQRCAGNADHVTGTCKRES